MLYRSAERMAGKKAEHESKRFAIDDVKAIMRGVLRIEPIQALRAC
jgi:hypothetical protein